MKIISLLIIVLFTFSGVFAQKGKVTSALNFKETGKMDQAVAAIEEAVDPANIKSESSIAWARTWEVRGEIYQAVYKSKDENYRKLHVDPLLEALKSYKKAVELDDKGKLSNGLKIKLHTLINDLSEQAVTSFNDLNYSKALASFEQILDIQDDGVYKEASSNAVDTAIIFNAGLAAYNAKQYDKAIEFYKKAAILKYNGARSYGLLSVSYLSKGDTTGAINSMQEGLNDYPGDEEILVQLINIYRKMNKADEAMKYLDQAISKDATNESFHFVRGVLCEQLQKTDEAIKCYGKAIELKPDLMDAYFNLGIVYYNRGVKQIDVANEVPSNQVQKYDDEKLKADMEFKTALPFLEKAQQLNDKDKMTLESLKNVYYRLQMLDKHAAVVEKMQSIQ